MSPSFPSFYATTLGPGEAYASQGYRASDDSGLPITIEQYLELVEWTGRQIQEGKRGIIPGHLAPILERLNIDASLWVDAVDSFDQWTRLVVANATRMAEKATEMGRHFLQGVRHCRELFRN